MIQRFPKRPHWRVLTVGVKHCKTRVRSGMFRVLAVASGFCLSAPARTQDLWDVHLHFDCKVLSKVSGWSISIFVDNVRLPGPEDFEFWNAVFTRQAWDIGRCFIRMAGAGGTFCTLLQVKRWRAWVGMWAGFGGHSSWQARYLLNLGDVLKGSTASFCETVVTAVFGTWWWFRVAGAILLMPHVQNPNKKCFSDAVQC